MVHLKGFSPQPFCKYSIVHNVQFGTLHTFSAHQFFSQQNLWSLKMIFMMKKKVIPRANGSKESNVHVVNGDFFIYLNLQAS